MQPPAPFECNVLLNMCSLSCMVEWLRRPVVDVCQDLRFGCTIMGASS